MEHGTLEANVVVLSTEKEAAGERIYYILKTLVCDYGKRTRHT
jgi:hypothetical protein